MLSLFFAADAHCLKFEFPSVLDSVDAIVKEVSKALEKLVFHLVKLIKIQSEALSVCVTLDCKLS